MQAAVAVVFLSGCVLFQKPEGPAPPAPRPTPVDILSLIASECPPSADVPAIVRTCGTAPRPETLLCVIAICKGFRTPAPVSTSAPTVTVTPTATVAPRATATSAPTAETAVPIGGICIDTPDHPEIRPAYATQVRAAIERWLAENPTKWRQHSTLPQVLNAFMGEYYFGVVANLRAAGLDAVVDDCGGCGEIAVAARGDGTFHEQYHILISVPAGGLGGDVHWPLTGGEGTRAAGFRAVCRPRGFGVGAVPPTPTAPAPPVAQATCPPLLTTTAATKGARQSFTAGPGWLIDLTPRFLIDGKDKPCNREKWANCGSAGGGEGSGDLCEPAPEYISVEYRSSLWNANDTGYAGRVVGPEGSPFTVTVHLRPGALDKAGRPIDVHAFTPFVLRGSI